MSSIIPDLFEAVFDALDDAELDAVVSWGPPPEPAPAEYVAVGWGNLGQLSSRGGESAESSREWGVLPVNSPRPVDEVFKLPITVDTLSGDGQNFQPAYERSADLADAVEVVLGADISQAASVFQSLTVERREQFYRTEARNGVRVFLTLAGMGRRPVSQ